MIGATLQFPWKLHVLLAHTESKGWTDIVSWLPEGTAFKVHDKKRFEQYIMPKFFKTTTYKSFQRNCNIWGFETKTRGFETGFLFHPYFQKGKSDLCNRMVRGGKETPVVFNEKAEAITSTASTTQDRRLPQHPKSPQSVAMISQIQNTREQNPFLAKGKQTKLSPCFTQKSAESNVTEQLALLILLQQEQQQQREQEEIELKRKEAQRQKEQMDLFSAINRLLVAEQKTMPSSSFSSACTKLLSSPSPGLSTLSATDGVSHSSPTSSSLLLSQIRRDLAAQKGHTNLIPCRARGVPLTHNSRVRIQIICFCILF